MKAVTLVKNGDAAKAFEIREHPDPELQPDDVRLESEAFGLNFADVMARLGIYRDAPPLPSILGYESVGRVTEVGSAVDSVSVGDRVVAFTKFGSYGKSVVTPHYAVARVPDDMDPGVATALATQFCTAYYCAEEMVRLHPGDHVLVQAAAGGVGMALVQLAKHRGCIVYGTAGSEEKLEFLRELGVDHPINYREHDFAEVVSEMRGDDGLDVVFDSIGGSSVKKGLELLSGGGRIVCFGAAQMAGKRANIFRTVKMASSFGFPHPIGLMMTSRAVIGVNMLRIAEQRPMVLKRCLDEVVRLVGEGVLVPRVGGTFPVSQIAEAHEYLGLRKSIGKVVVTWDE